LLLPEIDRQKAEGQRVAFRADAAFARPAIYEALETRGVGYAIRIPANKNLELAIEDILFRLPGRPSRKTARPVQELLLSGGQLDHGPTGGGKSRASRGRAVPARRLHRDEPHAAQSCRRTVL
jgi:Transposase DDE domain group 1